MSGPDQLSTLPQRALGSLFLAGATIGLVSLLLPHSPQADVVGLYSNVALAFATGIALWILAARVPFWTLHLVLAAGTQYSSLATHNAFTATQVECRVPRSVIVAAQENRRRNGNRRSARTRA